ncbi:hypothetical protein HV213_07355 [Klebsiella sp. RHBSTW-00484]|uniref:hypothetical protein n=1 Tax=unclassified Klebsiella TaxID=2608929 RepID=UPI0015E52376|nr:MULTISPECIES: hypothetical protein [unclassified Klebsiella]QLO35661.1 hypothetical protein HV213_07355 [Klebsiella sp. RHBSTW-00484]QLT75175.1 hypothetical protein HV204_07355 [Klebsiella sp. RHBSTW-00464]
MLRIYSGLQNPQTARTRNPGKALCTAPGEKPQSIAEFPGGDAPHLFGLQNPQAARTRSPGKAHRAAPRGLPFQMMD